MMFKVRARESPQRADFCFLFFTITFGFQFSLSAHSSFLRTQRPSGQAVVAGATPPPRYKHAFVYIAHSLIFIGFRYLTLSEGVGHVLIEIKRL